MCIRDRCRTLSLSLSLSLTPARTHTNTHTHSHSMCECAKPIIKIIFRNIQNATIFLSFLFVYLFLLLGKIKFSIIITDSWSQNDLPKTPYIFLTAKRNYISPKCSNRPVYPSFHLSVLWAEVISNPRCLSVIVIIQIHILKF